MQATPHPPAAPCEVPDEELVARAQRELPHHTDSFSILMQRHLENVLRRARRILGSGADAEDVAQDVCQRVLLALPAFQPEQPFVHWLNVVVRNTCLARLARQRRHHLSLAAHAEDLHRGASATPDPILRNVLHELLDALSPRTRAAVELRFLDGLTYQEIAAALGAKESAVKMRVSRACSAMRSGYESKLAERAAASLT